MKHLFLVLFILLSATLWAQTNVRNRTLSLLQWLVENDRIAYLDAKSNAAVFYHKDALTEQALITDSGKTIPNTCLKDFLSPK